jgi:hypothetical protein
MSLLINSIFQNSYTLYGIAQHCYMPHVVHNGYRYVLNQQAHLFRGKLNFLFPEGGFVRNNSQRLLIMSGSEHHVSSVPAAILFEPPCK